MVLKVGFGDEDLNDLGFVVSSGVGVSTGGVRI